VWPKYNVDDKIVCSKVLIGREGDWEPVIPPYVRRLERLLQEEATGKKPTRDKLDVNDEDEGVGM